MMEKWYRLAFSGLVVLLLIPVYLQGRSDSPHCVGNRPAFFHPANETVRIRITGNVPRPGVHDVPAGTTVLGAIKLTAGDRLDVHRLNESGSPVLKGGEVLCVTHGSALWPGISLRNMTVREKMLLGIRLDPNVMGPDDWEALPGIGPALARRIIEYRQKYGDFGSLDAVRSVPGVGEGTIRRVQRYF
jgi:competence protein ComEA